MTEERLLVFGSTFRVMTADRRLAAAGVRRGLSPTPRGIPSPCGLCLRIPAEALPAAWQVVGDLAPQIWLRNEAGEWLPAEVSEPSPAPRDS